MPPEKIKLSIIVLFYHGERWIDACIRSLENQSLSRAMYEIIIVDNGGFTPSVYKFKHKDNISVIYFRVNQGFAGGNNKALSHARGDIILLINQDVVVHFNCLEEILKAFDSHPEAGVISASMKMVSKLNSIDPNSKAPGKTGFFKLTRFGYASYFLIEGCSKILPVNFVSGNALGFRKAMLKDIDNYLFDDRLGSYAEDLDFSLRLKRTKWKMYVYPQAVIYHFRDDSFSGKPCHMLSKLIRVSSNRLLVYYDHLTFSDFFKKFPSLLMGIPLKVSRLDGETHFNLFRFIITLGLLPFILLHFVFRIPERNKN